MKFYKFFKTEGEYFYRQRMPPQGGTMSYKQPDNNFSFTDLSLLDTMERNRAIS